MRIMGRMRAMRVPVLERDFVEQGGIRERMTRARLEARKPKLP